MTRLFIISLWFTSKVLWFSSIKLMFFGVTLIDPAQLNVHFDSTNSLRIIVILCALRVLELLTKNII